MKFQTNKEKGNAGLAMAIAYFSTNKKYCDNKYWRKVQQI